MSERSELRLSSPAKPGTAAPMRHALTAFLAVLEIEAATVEDIAMAVGEALANAVEHAYSGNEPGYVELHARVDDADQLSVEVRDEGEFIEREPQANRGFGLRIVRTVARAVSVDTNHGTRVLMTFHAARRCSQEDVA